ncbi:MAG: phage tail tape measure protein, partial [Rhizobiales bacterium]|nr:phage tail tape measure protein [Hyphomicrobiales bacterium]
MTIETVTIEVDADTEEARRSFNALNSTASTFGRQITRALTDATVKGKDLDDVFRSLALSLSNSALTSGLKPLQDALSAGLGSLFSGLSGGGGAGGA